MTSVRWTTEQDIVSADWSDWMAAHTSFCYPLHHYIGTIALDKSLALAGNHKVNGRHVDIVITPTQLLSVEHGFDDIYTMWHDRNLGLWYKPLMIKYQTGDQTQKLYLAVQVTRWRTSKNDEWLQRLVAFKSQSQSQ